MIRRVLPSLITLIAVLAASCTSSGMPTINARAPDFELNDTEGKVVSLSDFLGRPVAVNFWGINCVYCIEEMPLLQEAFEQESAAADGVVILTVNVQNDAAATRAFLAENGYTLPALVDSSGRVADAYNISAIPVTFFIDSKGVVRYVKRGLFISINEVNVALNRVR